MSLKQKKLIVWTSAFALVFGITPAVNAMHIMEGYLPAGYCISWGVLCIPFLIAGFLSIQKTLRENRNLVTLLAMSGAFVFVISSLKIPSVTGSCSHMTGTGLGAILFGPAAVSVLGLIVLLFQAILLAHGGLTTIGANTFSMAIAGVCFFWNLCALQEVECKQKGRDLPCRHLGRFIYILCDSRPNGFSSSCGYDNRRRFRKVFARICADTGSAGNY